MRAAEREGRNECQVKAAEITKRTLRAWPSKPLFELGFIRFPHAAQLIRKNRLVADKTRMTKQ
jgi:hypothetical protein